MLNSAAAIRERWSSEAAGPASSWLRILGVLLIALKLAAVTLVFDPGASLAFALPKSAVSRGLTYAIGITLAAFIWRYHRLIRWRLASRLILGYVLVAVASSALAVDQRTALFGSLDRRLGLTAILDGAVTAFAVSLFVRGARELAVVGVSLLGATAAALGYFALQLAGYDPFRWTELSRAATLGNTTVLAGFLVTVLAGVLTALATGWTRLGRWSRAGLLGLSVGSAGAIAIVAARGAMLAMPVAVLTAALLAWRTGRHRLSVRAVLALALPLAIGLAVTATTPTGARLIALIRGGDPSMSERALIYQSAFQALTLRPFLGSGLDTFIAVYPAVRTADISRISGAGNTQSAEHSWVLHQAVGTGGIGLLTIVGVVVAALHRAWRSDPGSGPGPFIGAAMLVTFLAQAFVSVQHVATEMLFWVALGLIGVAELPGHVSARAASPPRRRARQRRPADAALAALALATGLVLASSVIPSVAASREVLASSRALAEGRIQSAQQHAEQAVAFDGGRADHWNALGIAYSSDRVERARRAFERATQLAPYDSTYLLNLARAELTASSADPNLLRSAAEHARVAAVKDPLSPMVLQTAAEILASAGAAGEGADLVDRLRAELPADVDLARAANVYEAAGRRRDAVRVLEEYASARWPAGPPIDFRLRLAAHYHELGDVAAVDRLIPRAQVRSAVPCGPECLIVEFESLVDLRTDDSPGSVLSVGSYRFRGVSLPPGSALQLESGLRVRLLLPGVIRIRPGDTLEASRVLDAFGRGLLSGAATVK